MIGALPVLLVACLLLAITLLLHRFIDGYSAPGRLPATWFYASWLVGLALLSLPLFRYYESFNEVSASYLIGVLFAFSFGSVVAAFWSRKSQGMLGLKPSKQESAVFGVVSSRWLSWLLLLGLLGSSLMLLNTLLGGGLSFAERLDVNNLAAVRLAHMTPTESHIGLFYGPAALMSSIGGLGVAYAFFYRGARVEFDHSKRWLSGLAFAVLFLNIVIGFVAFGSRIFAVFALLVAFLAFLEGKWSIGERLIIRRLTIKRFVGILFSVILALTFLWVAATYFLEKRVQGLNPQALLYRTHRATFDPLVYVLTRNDITVQYFMFSVSYFSTPIPTLSFYLDLPESRQPGPFFGEYNFPAIGRWVRRLTFSGDPYFWERARYEIFRPLSDINFGTNVWSTLVRDLIADFTKGGAILFIALLGFLSQRTYDLNKKSPSARRVGLLVHLRLLLMFSGFISILFVPQFHWALYLALLMLALGKLKQRREIPSLKSRTSPLLLNRSSFSRQKMD